MDTTWAELHVTGKHKDPQDHMGLAADIQTVLASPMQ